ncbi:MAG: fumarylacetoacetase [Paracoccaceae bacterium]|jgi:fumarylacetoacetase
MELLESWVTSANSSTSSFPLNNLPYGVFSTDDLKKRCGIAIGDMILDCQAVEAAGLINFTSGPLLQSASWNGLMELGPLEWAKFRMNITSLLCKKSKIQRHLKMMLVRQTAAELHMPFKISEFTDFWSSKNHAINAGTILRGRENALPENWQHIPIGYNGRASSVNVSGTNFRRPWGQIKRSNISQPEFSPSERFDFELEMGAIVGVPSNGPVTVQEAEDMIFGYVVLNDWSARDIQAWEGQPLGPFQAKATATTISPWIVTKAALEPFRCNSAARDPQLLSYLEESGSMFYDIDLTAILTPKDGPPCVITRTNFKEIYYTSAQQLAHHTTSGCPMNSGDLLGSGTISGSQKLERGSMLELSWGGREPLTLENGEVRSFLEDFDTLTLCALARNEHITIGFGKCTGTLLPALIDPYSRE